MPDSPRDEVLRTGCIGEAGARLLYRTVATVALGRNFPPPQGSARWDSTSVTETAHDFVQGERGTKRITDITLRSMDDDGFARLLEAAVVNFLREVSRRTDMGKLILRVTEVLRTQDEFRHVRGTPTRWALAGGSTQPSTAGSGFLAAAVADVEVVTPAWSSSRRDAPLADRPSFTRLLVAALTAAGGSLTATEVAHVVTARLDHRRSPLSVELDVLERVAERGPAADPAATTVSRLRAQQLFDGLDDRERIMLALPDTPVRELARDLALGRSQAALLRGRLHERLREELTDDDDPEATVGALGELCDSWLGGRTGRRGASFDIDSAIGHAEDRRGGDARA